MDNTSPSTRRIMVMLFLTLSAGGCTRNQSDDGSGSAVSPVVAVKVARITSGNVDVVVRATGRTEALRQGKVFSPIAGKIISMKVLEGTTVKGGDVVAVIRSRESEAAITGSQALLRSARTPEEEEEARRTLDLAQSTQSSVTVRAPFDGMVGKRSTSEGELITEGAELISLVDLSTITFVADVSLQDLASIRVGQQCNVRFPSLSGDSFPGRVDAINPQTETESQTVEVRLSLSDRTSHATALRTDMAGVATIITGTHQNALIVPKAALLRNDETGTFSLVTVTQDSLARVVTVGVGASTDTTVEILSEELHSGVRVVIDGQYALTDSTRVRVGLQENP